MELLRAQRDKAKADATKAGGDLGLVDDDDSDSDEDDDGSTVH